MPPIWPRSPAVPPTDPMADAPYNGREVEIYEDGQWWLAWWDVENRTWTDGDHLFHPTKWRECCGPLGYFWAHYHDKP